MPNAAIFFDRDGVLNQAPGPKGGGEYILSIEELVVDPQAWMALHTLKHRGWKLICISNQSCVGHGLISFRDEIDIMVSLNEKLGGSLDQIYFCPHAALQHCTCRKPETDMLRQAAKDWELDLSHSWVVGDQPVDMDMAHRMGCNKIAVGSWTHEDAYRDEYWRRNLKIVDSDSRVLLSQVVDMVGYPFGKFPLSVHSCPGGLVSVL